MVGNLPSRVSTSGADSQVWIRKARTSLCFRPPHPCGASCALVLMYFYLTTTNILILCSILQKRAVKWQGVGSRKDGVSTLESDFFRAFASSVQKYCSGSTLCTLVVFATLYSSFLLRIRPPLCVSRIDFAMQNILADFQAPVTYVASCASQHSSFLLDHI